jgi:hypothetical protein
MRRRWLACSIGDTRSPEGSPGEVAIETINDSIQIEE